MSTVVWNPRFLVGKTFPTKFIGFKSSTLGIPKQLFFYFKAELLLPKKQPPQRDFRGKIGSSYAFLIVTKNFRLHPKTDTKIITQNLLRLKPFMTKQRDFCVFHFMFSGQPKKNIYIYIPDKKLKNIVDVPLWRTSHPYMGVSLNGGTPISHPKCWSFLVGKTPWLLGKPTILGNLYI